MAGARPVNFSSSLSHSCLKRLPSCQNTMPPHPGQEILSLGMPTRPPSVARAFATRWGYGIQCCFAIPQSQSRLIVLQQCCMSQLVHGCLGTVSGSEQTMFAVVSCQRPLYQIQAQVVSNVRCDISSMFALDSTRSHPRNLVPELGIATAIHRTFRGELPSQRTIVDLVMRMRTIHVTMAPAGPHARTRQPAGFPFKCNSKIPTENHSSWLNISVVGSVSESCAWH